MTSTGPIGFWSYVHRNDALDQGRIVRLAVLIANEYEMITGEPIRIFVDRQDIEWGTRWREVIDNALLAVAFFIPIITPLYLRSEECRREFVQFMTRVNQLGSRELLLPILYAPTSEVTDKDKETDDEIARAVRDTQYVDWTTLRREDENSSTYRQAVGRLAERLASITSSLTLVPTPAEEPSERAENDEPGILDQIADAEDQIEGWHEIIDSLTASAHDLHELLQLYVERLNANKSTGNTRARLAIIHAFARDLEPIANSVAETGQDFGRSAVIVDPGVRAAITLALQPTDDAETREKSESFLRAIHELAENLKTAADTLKGLNTEIQGQASMARALRQPFAKLRNGFGGIIDASAVILGWEQIIKSQRPI